MCTAVVAHDCYGHRFQPSLVPLSGTGILHEGEEMVLFNNTLNTFYLQIYSIRHMVKQLKIVKEETCCHFILYYMI